MYQTIPMTETEARKVYGKMEKADLINMLIACNQALNTLKPVCNCIDSREYGYGQPVCFHCGRVVDIANTQTPEK